MKDLSQISQLRNQHIRERQLLIDSIELLNDNNLNIVEIDGTIYQYQEFVRPDDAVYDIEVFGRNITTIVSHQLETHGLNPQAITAMLQLINAMPQRRRRFHRDTNWNEYLATGN